MSDKVVFVLQAHPPEVLNYHLIHWRQRLDNGRVGLQFRRLTFSPPCFDYHICEGGLHLLVGGLDQLTSWGLLGYCKRSGWPASIPSGPRPSPDDMPCRAVSEICPSMAVPEHPDMPCSETSSRHAAGPLPWMGSWLLTSGPRVLFPFVNYLISNTWLEAYGLARQVNCTVLYRNSAPCLLVQSLVKLTVSEWSHTYWPDSELRESERERDGALQSTFIHMSV